MSAQVAEGLLGPVMRHERSGYNEGVVQLYSQHAKRSCIVEQPRQCCC